jgi:AcrR family transcriptional regulator
LPASYSGSRATNPSPKPRNAGLTHGAFCKQFESKDELLTELLGEAIYQPLAIAEETTALSFVIPSEAEGSAVRLNPKQKPPRVSSQVLPKTFVAWERGCPQFATPGVGANKSAVEKLVV